MGDKKKTIIIVAIALVAFGAVVFLSFDKGDNDKHPDIVKVGDNSITTDLKNNRFDEALLKVDDLLVDDPENTDLLLLKAEILLAQGSANFTEEENALEAQEIINAGLEKENDNDKAYRLLGYSYEIQNMFEEALENYDKSLDIKETSDAYNWKGHTYELMGDVEKAEQFYKKAVDLDENNRMALRNLARINSVAGKTDEARKVLEALIEMPIDNISAVAGDYHSLGNIEFDSGDIDQSKNLYTKALEIDPSFMLAQVDLEKNRILFVHDRDVAIVNLITISQNNPKQVFPLEWLGFAYLENNDMDNAINSFNQAVELLPSDITLMPQQRTIILSRLNYYLSIAYSLNGDVEKAKEHMLKAMEGMNESTMIMLVNSLYKGENGPYKNIMHDADIAKLSEELTK